MRAQSGSRRGRAGRRAAAALAVGDRGRHAVPHDTGPHMVSVGYLALTGLPENVAALHAAGAGFEPWYRFFPWEDWRARRPSILDDTIMPLLEEWARGAERPEPR